MDIQWSVRYGEDSRCLTVSVAVKTSLLVCEGSLWQTWPIISLLDAGHGIGDEYICITIIIRNVKKIEKTSITRLITEQRLQN